MSQIVINYLSFHMNLSFFFTTHNQSCKIIVKKYVLQSTDVDFLWNLIIFLAYIFIMYLVYNDDLFFPQSQRKDAEI